MQHDPHLDALAEAIANLDHHAAKVDEWTATRDAEILRLAQHDGMSYRALAEIAGISKSRVAQIANGR